MTGVAVYGAVLAPGTLRPLVVFPVVGAAAAVAAAVVRRWPGLVPWAAAAALAAYAAGLAASSAGPDLAAPLAAAALLLGTELAYWSLEDGAVRETGEVLRRRVGLLAVLAAATAALGSVILAAASVRPAGGPLVLALGIAAAIGSFALLARFAHARG